MVSEKNLVIFYYFLGYVSYIKLRCGKYLLPKSIPLAVLDIFFRFHNTCVKVINLWDDVGLSCIHLRDN